MNELDSINQINFIQEGRIDIGFELNRKSLFKIRFDAPLMIGFYECVFDKRALMIYKSKTRSTGYFIRKKSWFYINQDIPKLSAHMKKKCLIDYRDNVRKKIIMLKKYETRKLRERADIN